MVDLLKVQAIKITSLKARALLETLLEVVRCLLMPTGKAQSSSKSEGTKGVRKALDALHPW